MIKETTNIVTLKWGNRYGPEYVNRLFNAVSSNLSFPFRFICFTDNCNAINSQIETFPIPEIDLPHPQIEKGWRKLTLFQSGLPINGPSLFLDLDLVIRSSLDRFFTYEPEKIPIIRNWFGGFKKLTGQQSLVGNSSIFRFLPNQHTFVYEQFLAEKEWALANFNPPQTYLTHCIRPKIAFFPEEWTASFKRHCRRSFPLNYVLSPIEPEASVVVFHGHPDPDEALAGYKGTKLHHFSKPASWIGRYWKS